MRIASLGPRCWSASIVKLSNQPTTSLNCEFHFGGEFHKGPVLELYPDGFFVETDAEIDRSTVLEIRLENPVSGESMNAESIVERRVEPAALAPSQPRGLRLRIFHLTPKYNALIGAIPPSRSAGRPAPSESRGLGEVGGEQGRTEVPLLDRAGEPIFEEEDPASVALVVDDGELSDVIAILRSLGVAPRRSTPNVEGRMRDFIPPTRLLVITAKRALSLGHSLDIARADFTAVVVTDSEARTLQPIVHRLGYRFVIRRPVHPEALRTLLRQTLHRDGGRRASPRVASGCRARWRLSGTLRRRDGTLADLSHDSCRLLVRNAVPMNSRVHIRIPADVTGSRRIDVCGRVARRASLSNGQRELGIVFENLAQRASDRLARLVQALATGPARFDGKPEAEASFAEPDTATEPQPEAPAGAAPRTERRRNKRGSFQRELVALDVGSEEVRLPLIGRDLSIDGMRVEPNPELQLDDHLRLAFFDSEDGEPLTLHAVVTRIDGRLGSCLRFIGLDAASRSRLDKAIGGLPSIESVDDPDPEAAWAAIGQVELISKEVG